MKNIINKHLLLAILIFLIIGKESFSQYWVYFTGSVTEVETENPVPDYPILVFINDSLCLVDTFTDQQGIFYDSVFIEPTGFNNIQISVFDCEGMIISHYFQELDTVNMADFNICVNNENCLASFQSYIDPINQNKFYFFNLSQGEFSAHHWDFGDGTTSNEFDPMHLFNSSGVYNVCLTIEDSLSGCFDVYCESIVVGDPDCNADFTWQPDEDDPLKIYFTDLSSGNIMNWFWDFGDMIYSEEQSPTHQYTHTGQFLVTLTIMDSAQICYDVMSQWVEIWDSTYCTADFNTVLDTLNNIPNVYHFHDNSVGNPENWYWDFGDGQISFEQNPTHQFEQSGSYEVCLTVSSNNGTNDCFDITCKTISTLEYYNFGGQVFIGDYPINIEDEDSSNIAVAYLYRRYDNQWELMDTRDFWKFGYYWFADKPEGEYIIRTDLLPESDEYGNYAPVYHNNTSFWTDADIFNLNNDEEFSINISLKPLTEFQSGIGSINGTLIPGYECNVSPFIDNQLVYLLNANYQKIAFTYTDELGSFTFDGLGLSSYFVKAEVTGKSSPTVSVQLTENDPTVSEVSLYIDCHSFVGIEETQLVSTFEINNIYPLPASDLLTVEMDTKEEASYSFELVSIEGKSVWSDNILSSKGKNLIDVNVSSLDNGLYLLKISDIERQEIKTKKIIIN